MEKTIEQIIDEQVQNIKAEENTPLEIFKRNKDVASCNFVARTTGIISGVKIVQMIYKRINPKISFSSLKEDGMYVNRGDVICVITGPVYDILKGEKLASNFLRYMSGIASSVNKYLQELSNLDAKIVYSGHCAPGLDEFAEKAFIDGGGILNEEKKNYCVLSKNIVARFESYYDATESLHEIDHLLKPIVEVSDQYEFEEAYQTKCPVIRVCTAKDNILQNIANLNQDKKILEVYSEIDLKKIRSIAKMGYKYFIIPSLTDGAKSLSIDLCFYKRVKLK